ASCGPSPAVAEDCPPRGVPVLVGGAFTPTARKPFLVARPRRRAAQRIAVRFANLAGATAAAAYVYAALHAAGRRDLAGAAALAAARGGALAGTGRVVVAAAAVGMDAATLALPDALRLAGTDPVPPP